MDKFDLKALQKKILEMAEYFDSFCKKHEIVYYLMGGTALGAIRHGGFIPWDDDFDVFMDYENYQKFLKIASSRINFTNYYLQKECTEEWPLFFSKLRMNGTTFIEKDVVGRDMHHGIYIDVMCLNNAFDNIFLRYCQYLCARALSAGALNQKGYITKSLKKRVALTLASCFLSSPLRNNLLRFVRCLNKKDTKLVGHFFGRAPFKRTSFLRECLGEQRYIPFETTLLPVPERVENYLSVRYGGDYMKMPSNIEKSKYPSHAYLVDTNCSYEKYLGKNI
ncbi:MAG: LicD family protein [Gammaproteobacteria bacterium]|nr:LicD family protein [Gammaproteobacteria bacterium]